MAYLSNLPPGCTTRMIDEQCPDEWRCLNCGELLTDEELATDEEGDCLCETCAAVRRIARLEIPERFYRVAANSCELTADSFSEAA